MRHFLFVMICLCLPLTAQAQFLTHANMDNPFPTEALDHDVARVKTCAYDIHYDNALACIGKVTQACYDEGYDEKYAEPSICVRREWLAWDVYEQAQLADAKDRFSDASASYLQTLDASEIAYQAYRLAECTSEYLSWQWGEKYLAYESCMLRLTAQRAVFLGVKGVP